MTPEARPWLERLAAARARLSEHARGGHRGRTAPDPASGERWEAGEVWAHLAEFPLYWTAQLLSVVGAGSPAPVPFGRTKQDEERIAAIARDRDEPVTTLWPRVAAGMDAVGALLERLRPGDWERRGLHSTLGVMPLERIVGEFLVGHLEEHLAQLDGLAAAPGHPAPG